MKRTTTLLLILFWMILLHCTHAVTAQVDSLGGRKITLQETITAAHKHSVEATVALAHFRTAYWQYRTHKANQLPEMQFVGSLPNYKSGYDLYQESDGSYRFIRSKLMQSTGTLSVDQNIPITGGKISITSSLEYLSAGKDKRYFMSIPVTVTLVQPLFGYNALKWQQRIAPVRYQEARALYLEESERITMQAVQHFFELLIADEALLFARQNRSNAAKLYDVAKVRKEMGQISQNELLQLHLNLLQAEGKETQVQAERNNKEFRLKSFLGIQDDAPLLPLLPEQPQVAAIDYEEVQHRAHQHNSLAHRIRRQQLEADSNLAQAKGERYKIDLFASVGLSGQDRELVQVYRHLHDNQVVQVGVRIPLLDWGKRKAQVRMAEANREVVQAQIRQDNQRFDQDLYLLVRQFNNQAQQLSIAQRADEIAEQRHHTSIESFMIGKISTLELNDAQRMRDEARQHYLSELFYYWYYLYQVQSISLYDYQAGVPISQDFDLLIE